MSWSKSPIVGRCDSLGLDARMIHYMKFLERRNSPCQLYIPTTINMKCCPTPKHVLAVQNGFEREKNGFGKNKLTLKFSVFWKIWCQWQDLELELYTWSFVTYIHVWTLFMIITGKLFVCFVSFVEEVLEWNLKACFIVVLAKYCDCHTCIYPKCKAHFLKKHLLHFKFSNMVFIFNL